MLTNLLIAGFPQLSFRQGKIGAEFYNLCYFLAMRISKVVDCSLKEVFSSSKEINNFSSTIGFSTV